MASICCSAPMLKLLYVSKINATGIKRKELIWNRLLVFKRMELDSHKAVFNCFTANVPSSATQGQLVGAGKSLAGEKKIRAKKSQEGK